MSSKIISDPLPIITLASTSLYRAELLTKMGLHFKTQAPQIDEEALKNNFILQKKSAVEIAEELSQQKTKAVYSPGQVVIGGDQLVSLNHRILGKPNTKENAIEQLLELNEKTHDLITAVTIMTDQKIFHLNHITKLHMKKLTLTEIKNYVDLDLPLDCAGSYKIERSGICLFNKIECDDFSSIQGLPMIWVSTILKGCGYELFSELFRK